MRTSHFTFTAVVATLATTLGWAASVAVAELASPTYRKAGAATAPFAQTPAYVLRRGENGVVIRQYVHPGVLLVPDRVDLPFMINKRRYPYWVYGRVYDPYGGWQRYQRYLDVPVVVEPVVPPRDIRPPVTRPRPPETERRDEQLYRYPYRRR